MKKNNLFMFCILSILMVGCQNSENTNNTETKQNPELAKSELFSKVYSEDNIKSQLFTVNSKRDTSIITEHGTIYRIYNNSFEACDGSTISPTIDIEIKEALSPVDFVMANLTTVTSDNQLLESGGMIYINAMSDGKQLQLANENEIGIMLPHDSVNENMSIYEGSKV